MTELSKKTMPRNIFKFWKVIKVFLKPDTATPKYFFFRF